MNNPQQGSCTEMVRQNAQIFPAQPTVNPFLAMIPAQLRRSDTPPPPADPVPPAPSLPISSEAVPASLPKSKAQKPKVYGVKRREGPSLMARFEASGLAGPLVDALARITPEGERQAPAVPLGRPLLPSLKPQSVTTKDEPTITRLVVTEEAAVKTLTACLDAAPCRESSRRIFRTLFMVALHVARQAGHAASVTSALYHLPAELVMSHLGLQKSAFYDNLKYLREVGLIHCEAHMSDLRGKSVATGTLWAVSLQPERVLSGQAPRVRIRRGDWDKKWRNLNADVRAGRTVYNELYPITKTTAGQSRNPERVETPMYTLKAWATKCAVELKPDTLTLRPDPKQAFEVVWELHEAAELPRKQRAAKVDRQACTLAAAFGDTEVGFWRRLIWNLTRGIDAGTDLSQDAGAILSRVLVDVQHDLSSGGKPPRSPAAVANAALEAIRAHLELFKDNTVGTRPDAAA